MSKVFATNKLFLYALDFSNRVTEDTEIMSINMTDVFYDQIVKIGLAKELFKLNINGNVGSGKSTVGFVIGKYFLEKVYNKKFSITNIDRDWETTPWLDRS